MTTSPSCRNASLSTPSPSHSNGGRKRRNKTASAGGYPSNGSSNQGQPDPHEQFHQNSINMTVNFHGPLLENREFQQPLYYNTIPATAPGAQQTLPSKANTTPTSKKLVASRKKRTAVNGINGTSPTTSDLEMTTPTNNSKRKGQNATPQTKNSQTNSNTPRRRSSAPDISLTHPSSSSGATRQQQQQQQQASSGSANPLYAGASFSNSPLASALPIPVFSSRKKAETGNGSFEEVSHSLGRSVNHGAKILEMIGVGEVLGSASASASASASPVAGSTKRVRGQSSDTINEEFFIMEDDHILNRPASPTVPVIVHKSKTGRTSKADEKGARVGKKQLVDVEKMGLELKNLLKIGS